MKNFDQLSPQAQSGIKLFRENYWQKIEEYNKNLFLSKRKLAENDSTDTFKSVTEFLTLNNCPQKDMCDTFRFLKSKNFYLPK